MKITKILTILLVILFTFSGTAVLAQDQPQSFLILANSNRLPNRLENRIEAAGGEITRIIPEIGIVVATSNDPNFPANIESISGIRSVVSNLTMQWISPESQVAIDITTLDTSSVYDNVFFELQWGHTAVGAIGAWEAGERGAGVRVAVLDTGYDLTHPDLVPNINFELSMDFTGEGLQYTLPDPFSHGTHVAGTIAAADNAFGVVGVAPEAELVLVKVLSDGGSGSFADVISGIVYAANVEADIINMSLGAYLNRSGVQDAYTARDANELINAIDRAVTYAYQSGTTVFASAGNAALNMDHTQDLVSVPSGSTHAISISATAPIGWALDPENTFLDNLASYSNYGKTVIDFAAPGGDYIYPGDEACSVAGLLRPCWVFDLVFSTGNSGWYWSAGTSMASPHAAGVAAIIIGANGGNMHPAQVAAALRSSADDLGKPGFDEYYGHGRVNAENYFN